MTICKLVHVLSGQTDLILLSESYEWWWGRGGVSCFIIIVQYSELNM